jgi:hypothetical protein
VLNANSEKLLFLLIHDLLKFIAFTCIRDEPSSAHISRVDHRCLIPERSQIALSSEILAWLAL